MARKAIVLLIGFFVFTLVAPQLSHAESMLTWDAVGEAQGYKIYYGTSSGSYIYSKDVGTAIQYPLANLPLEEGTTYYFVVRAYNDTGESGNSSESSYTVPSSGDTTPPLAPQGVTSGVSDGNITLSWKANTESDLAGYKIHYGDSSRIYGSSIPAGKVTSYTVDDLEPGKTYYLVVTALDSAENESGNSLEVVKTIPSADGGSAPAEGPMLQWDAAAEPVIGYKIYYGTSSGSYDNSKDVGKVTQHPLSDLSLSEGTTYYFITRAYSDVGESENSNEASYTTSPPADTSPPPETSAPADTSPPTVTISGPTKESTYATSSGSVNLSGSASDNIGVSQVNWVNSMGGIGTASGTAPWSISGIDLLEGENTLTVTAEDAAGNQSVDTITIIYTAVVSATAYELSLSLASDRSNPVPLQGGSVSEDIYVFTSPETGVSRVSFYLDDPGMSGSPIKIESLSPYDFAGGSVELANPYDSSQLSGGSHEITAFIELIAGGSETVNATFSTGDTVPEIDTTAPTVAITGPTNGGTYETNSLSINLLGDASDNVGVKEVIWKNSTSGASGSASGTETWSISDILLSEGDSVLTVTAKDAAGNQSSSTLVVTYTPVDTTLPVVWITLPVSGSTYETGGSSINLSGSASDNRGVTQVVWSNSQGGSDVASGTTSWSITDVDLAEGANVITVTAVDAAGNEASSVLTVSFTPPDTIDPLVSIKLPTDSSTYATGNSSIDLSGSAEDNVGVSKVTWVNSTRGDSGPASGISPWSISGISLSEGNNVLTVIAEDAAGNQSTDTLTVAYNPPDTTSPEVSIKSPTDGSTYATGSSSIDLSGSAEDNVGVSKVTWVNSTRGDSGPASGISPWSISGISLSEGNNVLTVTAEDAAGNQSTDTLTVAYSPPDAAPPQDTTAPVIRITSPTTRSKINTKASSISLSGSASDNVGVIQTTWVNSLGGNGTAIGTSSWSITNIPLLKGANVVTVTAKDAAGNQSTDTLTVNKR